MKESEKNLVGNMEDKQDITFPNSTDSGLFWETNIPKVDESKENPMLDNDNHIYDNKVRNKQGTKEEKNVFQLPQQIDPEKEIVRSATADHSEMTSPPNTTLRSNCTLIVIQLNIFICLLASFHVYLNFSIP